MNAKPTASTSGYGTFKDMLVDRPELGRQLKDAAMEGDMLTMSELPAPGAEVEPTVNQPRRKAP